jgi:hypothetical protein
MNFSIIVPIPNVSNTGEILPPTNIKIIGEAKTQFEYDFNIYHINFLGVQTCITDLYETLVGTAPDCDKRFTDPIEAHLGMLFSNSDKKPIVKQGMSYTRIK